MPAVSPNVSNPISSVALASGNNNIDALLSGYKWGGIVGTPVTVYFSFPTSSNPLYWSQDPDQYGYAFDETETLVAFSAAQQVAATSALQQWANVANITFQKVTETTSAVGDIRFGNTFTGAMEEFDYGYTWDLREISPGVASPDSGDIWLNRIQPVTTGNIYTAGAAGYHTILHEIGHALGIDHSFAEITPENPSDLGLQAGLDFYQYSVMSYDSYDRSSAGDSDYGYNEYYPTTLMLLDIQAIQHLYGANMTYRTGNDTYVFNSTTKYLQTIWDAGGIDTIQYSSAIGGVINLNQGEFSQLGKSYKVGQDPGFFAGVTQTHTVGIAYGAVIENAIGGSGNDTLIGNSANNVLDGGTGMDTLEGGAGNDTYIADLEPLSIATANITATDLLDTITETAGDSDTLKLRGAATLTNAALISLTGGFSTLENLDVSLTGATKLNLTGNDANNTLTGNSANNTITGGLGNDGMDGGAGADSLVGGNGDDTYVVDVAGDVIDESTTDGTDTVIAKLAAGATYTLSENLERLTAFAGAVGMNLTGNNIANTLTGNAGANILNGNGGEDTLIGGDGADTYITDGNDTIIETNALATGGIDLVKSTVDFNLSTAGTNVENLTLLTVTTDINNLSANNISATGNALANILTGNAGNNFFDGKGGVDTLIGGDGNDEYDVDLKQLGTGLTATVALEDVIVESITQIGGFDSVRIHGEFNLEKITTITLAEGIEVLFAQTTNFTKLNIIGNSGINDIEGNNANNIIYGRAGNDALGGQGGNDILYGEAGDDRLVGYWDNDTLDGGAGVDSLEGGAHNDTYLVDIVASLTSSPAPIIVTGVKLQDSILELVDEGIDTLKLRGTVVIPVATVATTIVLSDNILGNLANIENIDISATTTTRLNLTGNDANNILTGNTANNLIDGGTGADTLVGGTGNDTYIVDDLTDIVTEIANAGIDTVQTSVTYSLVDTDGAGINGGNVEHLTLLNGAGAINGTGNGFANQLNGNESVNYLIGLAGIDTLNGGGGADRLEGGDGNDIYIVDDSGDQVIETNATLAVGGTDLVKSSANNFTLAANVENLTLTDHINLNGGTTNINGTGNELANIIIGNAGANQLRGAAGIDALTGNDGNDTLIGGAGKDILNGGNGDDEYQVDLIKLGTGLTATLGLQDTISDTAGIDKLILTNATGGLNDQPLVTTEFTATSTFTLAAGLEQLDASQVNGFKLNLTGNTLNNQLIGNDTNNILLDSTGNDTLDGGAGNDTLDGGTGNDSLIGGDGNDTYIVDLKPLNIATTSITATDLLDTITETAGDSDTLKLRGSATLTNPATISLIDSFADIENLDISLTGTTKLNLTGNAANNILTGNTANNTLTGGLGNDTLDGGLGNDTLNGGDGDDTYTINVLTDVIQDSSGNDTLLAAFSLNLENTLANAAQFAVFGSTIENLTLIGTSVINATGNAGSNRLTGNDAANILNGNGGEDTLIGGKGADTYLLQGDNASQVDDTVIETLTQLQGGGIDLVKSNTTYTLGTHLENLTLTDHINLNGGTANINGTGNALANTITGNAGDNALDGKEGTDILFGGDGNDIYIVDNIGDITTETNALAAGGVDEVRSSVTGTLASNIEKLTLTGLANINGTGNTLNNNILGNDANNLIAGGIGNDTLNGGLGKDTLSGGTGNDIFVFNAIGASNFDLITDCTSGQDKIDLSGATFSAQLSAGIYTDMFVNGTAALDANDYIIYNKMTGELYFDTDGTLAGAQQLIAKLTPNTNLLQSDFVNAISTIQPVPIVDLTLVGTDVANTLHGGAGNDTLSGLGGDDILNGLGGNDTLNGGSDNDTLSGGGGNDVLDGGDGNDTLTDDDGNNTFIGGQGDDVLLGGYSDDILIGGAGNDTLNSGGGIFETLNGGDGNDTYVINFFGSAQTIIDSSGIDTVITNQIDLTALNNNDIENITLINGAGFSGSRAKGNLLTNYITGDDGDNTLDGGAAGADTLVGGLGNDTYLVERTDVTIIDSSGYDRIISSTIGSLIPYSEVEQLVLLGNSNISVTGNNLDNYLQGNDGNNFMDGGLGNDAYIGWAGDDTYVVDIEEKLGGGITFIDSVTTILYEDLGTDTVIIRGNVNLATAADININYNSNFVGVFVKPENLDVSSTGTSKLNLIGNDLDNILTGNNADNAINGLIGNDTLIGADGNDALIGDEGNDTLIGGNGNDNLNGGVGQDVFVFNTTLNALINEDTILGFSHADDIIHLSQTVFAGLDLGGLSADNYLAGTAALDNNDFIINNAGNLYYDADGNGAGAAIQFATLTGTVGIIGVDDFVIV